MSGYRDAGGRYIPQTMNAQDAKDAGLGDKYRISDAYQGSASTATATRTESNPYEFNYGNGGGLKGGESITSTGNAPCLLTVTEKFGSK
eukprot:m.66621 g.66621  ORF g.66621 m.66621 type:complete len:89 (-) comp23710_c0_seq2:280-546(-)